MNKKKKKPVASSRTKVKKAKKTTAKKPAGRSKAAKPVRKSAVKKKTRVIKDDIESMSPAEMDRELAEYDKSAQPRKAKPALPDTEVMKFSKEVAGYMFEKKAEDVVIADLTGLSSAADAFVIATATSDMHAKAIADHVQDRLETRGARLHHKEGYQSLKWILMDYVDVIVHVFQRDAREFYDLERLWGDAKFIKVEDR